MSGIIEAFFQAINSNDDELVLYKLEDEKLDPNVQNLHKRTGLMIAASTGHLNIVRLLLSYNADVTIQDKNGLTALDWARTARHSKIAKLLHRKLNKYIDSQRKLNVNAANEARFSDLSNENEDLCTDMKKSLMDQNIINLELCFKKGQSLKKKQFLRLANTQGIECVHFIDIEAKNGFTPLSFCASCDNTYLLKELMKQGASVDLESSLGHTALIWSAINNQINTASLLVQYQADIHRQTNREQKTALMFAVINGSEDMTEFLLRKLYEDCLRMQQDNLESGKLNKIPTRLDDWSDFMLYMFDTIDIHGNSVLDYAKLKGGTLLNIVENCINKCEKRREELRDIVSKSQLLPCRQGCGEVVPAYGMERHCLSLCICRLVPCLSCEEKVKASDMEYHLESKCVQRLVHCKYLQRGCVERVPFAMLNHHMATRCQKRPVACRLECGRHISYDMLVCHETEKCPNRVVECPMCSVSLRAGDLSKHRRMECSRRLVPCPLCKVNVEECNLEEHINGICKQPCRYCGEEYGPEDARILHERFLCDYRPVECDLKCGQTMAVKEIAEHKETSCSMRLVDCPLGCGLKPHACGIDDHIRRCTKRKVRCHFDLIEKRITFSMDSFRTYLGDLEYLEYLDDFPEIDFGKKLLDVETNQIFGIVRSFNSSTKLHEVYFSDVNVFCWIDLSLLLFASDVGQYICNFVEEHSLSAHISVCPLRKVQCPLGCGQWFQSRFVDQHCNVCILRKIVCDKCGVEVIEKDRWEHEESLCPRRRVHCPCGTWLSFSDWSQHKKICSLERDECELGCGKLVRRSEMVEHVESQCPKRCVQCPLGCKKPVWAEEVEDHCARKCKWRFVKCENCDEQVQSKDLENHMNTTCSKKPVPCPHCEKLIAQGGMDDHILLDCRMKLKLCAQGCGKLLPVIQHSFHEQHLCSHRTVKCRLGCESSMLQLNLKKHEETECVRRIVNCPHGCGNTMRFESIDDHTPFCEQHQLPCGAGSSTCSRMVKNWFFGDPVVGSVKLVICEPHGENVLTSAAATGNHHVCQLVMGLAGDCRGFSLEHETKQGHTALSRAVSSGSILVVKLLLEAGADPNHETTKGLSPLLEAAKLGDTELLQLLVSFGGDIRAVNRFGADPVTWARRAGNYECAELLFEWQHLHLQQRQLLLAIGSGNTLAVKQFVSGGKPYSPGQVHVLQKRLKHDDSADHLQKEVTALIAALTVQWQPTRKLQMDVMNGKREADELRELADEAEHRERECNAELLPSEQCVAKLLEKVTVDDLREVYSVTVPSKWMKMLARCVCHLLKIDPVMVPNPADANNSIEDWWSPFRERARNPAFIQQMLLFDKTIVKEDALNVLTEEINNPNFPPLSAFDENCSFKHLNEQLYSTAFHEVSNYQLLCAVSGWVVRIFLWSIHQETLEPIRRKAISLRTRHSKVSESVGRMELELKQANTQMELLEKDLRASQLQLGVSMKQQSSTQRQAWVARLLELPCCNGHSALTWAASFGQTEAMNLLLKNGAAPNWPDRLANTAAGVIQTIYRWHRHRNTRGEWSKAVARAVRLEDFAFKFALATSINTFHTVRKSCRLPLLEAVGAGEKDAVRVLIDHGCSVAACQFGKSFQYSALPPPPYALYDSNDDDDDDDESKTDFDDKSEYEGVNAVMVEMEIAFRNYNCLASSENPAGEREWAPGRFADLKEAVEEWDMEAREVRATIFTKREARLALARRVRLAQELSGDLDDAIMNQEWEKVHALWDQGALSDQETSSGHTALTLAASTADHIKDGTLAVASLLDRERQKPMIDKISSKLDFTALSIAARNSRLEVIEALISRGADPNKRLSDGSTALIAASKNGKWRAVQLLLENGSNVSIKDNTGKDAIQWATENNFGTVAHRLSVYRNKYGGLAKASFGGAEEILSCHWGCGIALPPRALKIHQNSECAKRFVVCRFNCGIDDLWAEEQEEHEEKFCARRLVPCPQECGRMIPFCEVEKHSTRECPQSFTECVLGCGVENIRAQNMPYHIKVECVNREVKCVAASSLFGCGEMVKWKDIPRHKKECSHRSVRCRLGCSQPLMAFERDQHERFECLRRPAICKHGCGCPVTIEGKETHETLLCSHRPTTCPLCNAPVSMANLDVHKEESCPYRFVPCEECGMKVREIDLERHFDECDMRDVECKQCGTSVKRKDKKLHQREECSKVSFIA
eukprot:TRINITY_DN202_c0_g2_i5.p1 TRINITY_DN202_c0_g2~~TRINITY_DN202_c0_g2_i5.p1  ORF type:complete len:2190 (+),score=448.19 TRINITY_DN202_c0_g2_i5:144-6713(+)